MSIEKLNQMNGAPCTCGASHSFSTEIASGKGAIRALGEFIRKHSFQKAYLLSDLNTWAAAGERVTAILDKCGLPYQSFRFPTGNPEPEEFHIGAAFMHATPDCDLVIGIGSGVINDISKIVSNLMGNAYVIVATAPSMDGYASATSSVSRDALKISMNSRCADLIIGDTDILCSAPLELMRAGLGDMIAKYVSICEWRIGHLVTGEYYCEEIASLVRNALQRCVNNLEGLMNREEAAVLAVFEGLAITGIAMKYAGCSRPASGTEHYISHSIDMRGEAFHTPVSRHGLQCGIGTLVSVRLYEKLLTVTPDREKALSHAAGFDLPAWHDQLRILMGEGAETMIEQEKRERKYDLSAHKERLERILANWAQIKAIVREELPSPEAVEKLLDAMGAPKTLGEIGTPDELLPKIICATKDFRDKYVFSRLAWDLGVLDEIVASF